LAGGFPRLNMRNMASIWQPYSSAQDFLSQEVERWKESVFCRAAQSQQRQLGLTKIKEEVYSLPPPFLRASRFFYYFKKLFFLNNNWTKEIVKLNKRVTVTEAKITDGQIFIETELFYKGLGSYAESCQ
jgi:hypothetical protein